MFLATPDKDAHDLLSSWHGTKGSNTY
ncbi:hypothetical protein RSAG8_10804, partial [Rhizoctonia solani AG-8 WAC10335]